MTDPSQSGESGPKIRDSLKRFPYSLSGIRKYRTLRHIVGRYRRRETMKIN